MVVSADPHMVLFGLEATLAIVSRLSDEAAPHGAASGERYPEHMMKTMNV